MLPAPIRSFEICISLQSNSHIRVLSRTNQSIGFVLQFERYSNFNKVMGDSERVVCKMESSFRMRNVGFSVFLTCILPCSTAQLKDIRLPKVNELLMLWKW